MRHILWGAVVGSGGAGAGVGGAGEGQVAVCVRCLMLSSSGTPCGTTSLPMTLRVLSAVSMRSGAYRVFTRKRVFLVKSSETPSVRPSARASICGRTVEELPDRTQELVAYILQGDPQAGTKKIPSCQERHEANRHDDSGSQ